MALLDFTCAEFNTLVSISTRIKKHKMKANLGRGPYLGVFLLMVLQISQPTYF